MKYITKTSYENLYIKRPALQNCQRALLYYAGFFLEREREKEKERERETESEREREKEGKSQRALHYYAGFFLEKGPITERDI